MFACIRHCFVWEKQSQERTRGFGHPEATGGLEESCFGEVGQSPGRGSEEAGEEQNPEQKLLSSELCCEEEPAGGIVAQRCLVLIPECDLMRKKGLCSREEAKGFEMQSGPGLSEHPKRQHKVVIRGRQQEI